MRTITFLVGLMMAVALVLSACGEKTAPTPASTATPAPTATSKPAAATPAATAVPTPTPAPKPPETIEVPVGLSFPLTGPIPALGLNLARMTQLSIEDVNKAGFMVGDKVLKLKGILEDNKFASAEGVAAANKLIFQDKVKFMVVVGTGVVSATQPISEQAGVLLFGGGWTPTMYGTKNPRSFTDYASSQGQALIDADWVVKNRPEVKKVYLAYADDPATRGFVPGVRNLLIDSGVEIVGADWWAWTETDFYPLISRILAKNPDAIFGTSSAASGADFVKQLWQRGWRGEFHSGGSSPVGNFVSLVGNEAANKVYTALLDFADPTLPDQAKDFFKRYNDKYGEMPSSVGPHMMVDPWVLARAMSKAGTTTDVDKIIKVMETETFDTPLGKLKYGGEAFYGLPREGLRPMPVTIYKDGKLANVQVYQAATISELIAKYTPKP